MQVSDLKNESSQSVLNEEDVALELTCKDCRQDYVCGREKEVFELVAAVPPQDLAKDPQDLEAEVRVLVSSSGD